MSRRPLAANSATTWGPPGLLALGAYAGTVWVTRVATASGRFELVAAVVVVLVGALLLGVSPRHRGGVLPLIGLASFLSTGARPEAAVGWWCVLLGLGGALPSMGTTGRAVVAVLSWAALSGMLYALRVPDPLPPLAGMALAAAMWALRPARTAAAPTSPA